MSEASDVAALVASTGGVMAVLHLDAPDAGLRDATISLWNRVQQALPFAPRNLVYVATQLWDRYRRFSYPVLTAPFSDPSQRSAWADVARGWQPLTASVIAGQIAAARSAAYNLQEDVELWERVRRVVLGVATYGVSELAPAVQAKWQEIKTSLARYRSLRKNALSEAADPKTPTARAAQLREAVAKGDATIMGRIANATGDGATVNLTGALAPEGLGATPIAAFASLGLAAQLAILAGIAAAIGVAIKLLSDLGVVSAIGAVGDLMSWMRQQGLGPILGAAILAGIGFVVYKRVKG